MFLLNFIVLFLFYYFKVSVPTNYKFESLKPLNEKPAKVCDEYISGYMYAVYTNYLLHFVVVDKINAHYFSCINKACQSASKTVPA